MAIFTLTDAILWVHDQDVGGHSNKLMIKPSADDLDSTVFGLGGFRRRTGGLKTVELSGDGFADSDAGPDAAAFAALGVADRAVTIAALSTEGSVAYACQAGEFSLETFGAVGELNPFTVELKGTNKVGLVRGQLAKAKGTVSATGALGTAQNLGAGTDKSLYATLHAFEVGTTVTVQVQSSATQAGSYTTRATFPAITAAGGAFLAPVDVSAVSDAWWRLNVSAITGTFTLAGAIAVQ